MAFLAAPSDCVDLGRAFDKKKYNAKLMKNVKKGRKPAPNAARRKEMEHQKQQSHLEFIAALEINAIGKG